MYFDSFSEFINMGGHGLYVWMAYGSTLLALLVNVVVVRGAQKRQAQRLRWQFQVDDQVASENAAEKLAVSSPHESAGHESKT